VVLWHFINQAFDWNNPLTQDPWCCLHETEEVHQRCFREASKKPRRPHKLWVVGAPSVRLVSLVCELCDSSAKNSRTIKFTSDMLLSCLGEDQFWFCVIALCCRRNC
jgi:hypothetical protein